MSQKKYWCNLYKIGVQILVGLYAGWICAADANKIYRANGKYLTIYSSGEFRICKINDNSKYAVESFDKSALIVSERGYMPIKLTENCSETVPIHVSFIPENVGFLSDINLMENIYVALDFVSSRPPLYLAAVAYIGSTKNIVNLNDSYTSGRKLSKLRDYAFGSTGEAGASIISPDGNFIAPSGQIACDIDAYPGVWDISKNKRVLAGEAECLTLFKLNK
ncbi:hypothetical protein QS306_06935 [Paraburkholderia bonniea]|uniref:hypothetical protein n=1 Tax=Paraburkholderia bonniea TaxID=2152891 RepID=UPI00129119A2|nr:hypothetical protein [Paraburkholderia bonniea]WJF88894.1 hypothetical protein QS306_06935 [Paraburkholderia bonniea]WJF92210.1 hypothetical protein QS308_06945 [Paraburkholderia bonniea]